MLDIIIPHYKEPWEEGKKFFDMLDGQRGIDFSQIHVIFVEDGEEGSIDSSCLEGHPYTVERLVIPHAGVSAARNAGLKASSAEWVMFCDFDDMLSNVYSLWNILNVLPAPDYDILWMDFYSEDKLANGKTILNVRGMNMVFIHGKLYRRQWLIENHLWFDTRLSYNEDSCFNAIAYIIVDHQRIGQIKTAAPNYIWAYREGSATLTPSNNAKMLRGLYERNKIVCEAYKRRLPFDNYCDMVARTVWDAYHGLNIRYLTDEHREMLDDFRRWYSIHKKCILFVSDESMEQIKTVSEKEQKMIREEEKARWGNENENAFREDISIDEWLNTLGV